MSAEAADAASGSAADPGQGGQGDTTGGDPVEAYTTRLAATLHGPAKDRARLVEEIHGGLMDATEAYVQAGTPPEEAPGAPYGTSARWRRWRAPARVS